MFMWSQMLSFFVESIKPQNLGQPKSCMQMQYLLSI